MIEAKSTEYNGVIFRSKSEAIFARNLDLGHFIWEYEPHDWSGYTEWLPDFLVLHKFKSKNKIAFMLIEYKPAPITSTYREWMVKNYLAMKSFRPLFLLLVCANCFEDTPRTIEVCDEGVWTEFKNRFLLANLDAARSYRFDLAG